MKSWLRSDNATLALLVLALIAQTPHTAALFHRLAPAADGALAWAGWLHAWAYALALEAGILLFVMRGRTAWAWGFAFASVLVNAGYYWTPGMGGADTLRAALISVMLPVAIARYSHEVADDKNIIITPEQAEAMREEEKAVKAQLAAAQEEIQKRERLTFQWYQQAEAAKREVEEYRQTKRGHIPESLRQHIIERCNYTCQYCARVGTEEGDPDGQGWNIDHVIPVIRGGPTRGDNLTLACDSCNSRKGSMPAHQFVLMLSQHQEQQEEQGQAIEPVATTPQPTIKARVFAALDSDPAIGNAELAQQLGVGASSVRAYRAEWNRQRNEQQQPQLEVLPIAAD